MIVRRRLHELHLAAQLDSRSLTNRATRHLHPPELRQFTP